MYKYLGENINSSFYQGINHKIFLQGILAALTKIIKNPNIIVSYYTKTQSGKLQLVDSTREWFDLYKIFENYPQHYEIDEKDIFLLNELNIESIKESHFKYIFKNYKSDLVNSHCLYIKDKDETSITEIFFEYNKEQSIDDLKSAINAIKIEDCLFSHYIGLLGNSFSDEITLKLDLFPSVINRNIDDEIGNLITSLDVQNTTNQSGESFVFSDHRFMLYLPEFKALFYRISNNFKNQIKKRLELWESDKKNEEKNVLLNELKKLINISSFSNYYNRINRGKVDFVNQKNKISEGYLDEDMVISFIEAIPQALGDGIVGESAITKIGFIIPNSLKSDYRRINSKIYNNLDGESNVDYLLYYTSMKIIEGIFLESPDDKNAIVYPLLEKGDLFGSLFLLTSHTDVSDLYEKFISSSKFIQDFTLNIKTILNTQFYENAAKSVLTSSDYNSDETYPILKFSLDNLHLICNSQLGFYIELDEILSTEIHGKDVFCFEKNEGLWEKKMKINGIVLRNNCELKHFLTNDVANRHLNIEKLMAGFPIYYEGKFRNFFRINPLIGLNYTDNRKACIDKILLSSVVFLPLFDSLNDKKLVLTLFFSEQKKVVESNILSIWQNLSSIFALNQFNIINKFNEFPKYCMLHLKPMFSDSDTSPMRIVNSWDEVLVNQLIKESPHFNNFFKNEYSKLERRTYLSVFLVETFYCLNNSLPKATKEILYNLISYFRYPLESQSLTIKYALYNKTIDNYFISIQTALNRTKKREILSNIDSVDILGEHSYLLSLKARTRLLILINYLAKNYNHNEEIY